MDRCYAVVPIWGEWDPCRTMGIDDAIPHHLGAEMSRSRNVLVEADVPESYGDTVNVTEDACEISWQSAFGPSVLKHKKCTQISIPSIMGMSGIPKS